MAYPLGKSPQPWIRSSLLFSPSSLQRMELTRSRPTSKNHESVCPHKFGVRQKRPLGRQVEKDPQTTCTAATALSKNLMKNTEHHLHHASLWAQRSSPDRLFLVSATPISSHLIRIIWIWFHYCTELYSKMPWVCWCAHEQKPISSLCASSSTKGFGAGFFGGVSLVGWGGGNSTVESMHLHGSLDCLTAKFYIAILQQTLGQWRACCSWEVLCRRDYVY